MPVLMGCGISPPCLPIAAALKFVVGTDCEAVSTGGAEVVANGSKTPGLPLMLLLVPLPTVLLVKLSKEVVDAGPPPPFIAVEICWLLLAKFEKSPN